MRDQDESPGRERWEGGHDDLEGKDTGKHRSTDKSKDHRSRDRERAKTTDISKEREKDSKESERERASSRSKRKESRDEREKDRTRDKAREKDSDRDKYREKDRAKEKERERVRDTEKDRDKEREKHKDRDNDRDKGKDRTRDKEIDKDRSRRKGEEKLKTDGEDRNDKDNNKNNKHESGGEAIGSHSSTNAIAERILKSREERLKKKNEGDSDVLAWVSKSRKLEEKRNIEKEKALQLSRVFEEQDDVIQNDSDDEAPMRQSTQHLSGVKVLHGLDKVIEGGAVVLTLKDQSILADGDINEEADMLENVEIGEQKQRNEAYKAAKKKTGIYDDKFNDEPSFERTILPQYDDPIKDEGVTLDAHGRFSGEAEKKLEELRNRLEGGGTHKFFEDLTTVGSKTSSDYYTHEEMLKFQKPRKKKSLRKKDKLDVDALEAEAVSAGLGISDLGSRNDSKRKSIKAEQDKIESEKRMTAYQSAYARAEEASKALKSEEKANSSKTDEESEDDTVVFDDDDEDLRKSLERARRVSLKKKEGEKPSIAFLASYASKKNDVSMAENDDTAAEPQENNVVFTEMEEFVWGLQLDEEAHKPDGNDVFMDEDPVAKRSSKEEDGGWSEVKEETEEDEKQQEDEKEEAEEIKPDEIIHEAAIGKGLSGALKLWKDRGALGQGVEWGGRNMDKKKSKVAGIYESDGTKEIRIERTDEYGRILTPKEAFRLLSHKFHGKGPGKMKLEKRIRQHEEEQKVKQMRNSDTPSLSAERMRDAQARLQTPYLVLSGSVRPGQTSDPRSGFATVEKDFPGGLTPMLGDRKVEHFLGIRKNHPGDMGPPPPKKPKP